MKNFKLRMSLFRIWFVKNIVVFLEIAAVVLFILVFTGVLPESTPIFGSLISEIRDAEGDSSKWIHAISICASCLGSISFFMVKAKSIALSDIKNDKLKLALVNANMYFNEQGKLVKKIEKATNTDLDGDGKIDDKDIPDEDKPENVGTVKVATNLFTGIKSMVQEFFAIATVKLDDDEETAKKQADDTIKGNNMREAAQAVHEIDDIKTEAFNKNVDKKVDDAVSNATEKIEENSDLSKADKEEQVSIFNRIGTWVKNLFHKEKKGNKDFETATAAEKSPTPEAVKTEKPVVKPEEKQVKKQEETTSVLKVVPEIKEIKKVETADDFLARLRKGH